MTSSDNRRGGAGRRGIARREMLALLSAVGTAPWAVTPPALAEQGDSGANRKLRVTGVQVFQVRNPNGILGGNGWVILKLLTNQGIAGYGQPYWIPFQPGTSATLVEEMVSRFVVGENPFRIEYLYRKMYCSEYGRHPDLTRMAVISGIEMACWDIVGKALNEPIHNLIGGRLREKLRSYSYVTPLIDRPKVEWKAGVWRDPKWTAEMSAAYVEEGFTAIKIDPLLGMPEADTPRQLSLAELSAAEKVVGAVREAVGDRSDIILGTHSQMTPSAAIRLARRLEHFDPLWFEEPIPPENIGELARVAQMTTIPIATGERLTTKFEFVDLLAKKAASILNIAVGRAGGILESKKIAALAEAFYAEVAPHLWCGPIAAAASLHVAATLPNFLIHEGLQKWGGFHADIVDVPIRWEKGYVFPPERPGLGVNLNEKVANQHPWQ